MKSNRYAVILAGGEGRRMNSPIPKQFLEMDGKPILRHTIEKFLDFDPDINIVVVLPADKKEYWKEYCRKSGFLSTYTMPSGGITRFHSVKNALEYIPDGAIVAVHDGVRPMLSREFLEELFTKAQKCDALIPVMPMVESVREVFPDGSSQAQERTRFVTVQTPQLFKSDILKKAYAQPYLTTFTDDASVVEHMGIKISLCEGRRENIKITTLEDLALVNSICGEA